MEKFSDNIKKVILAGIGAVAVTAEKSKDLLDEMVEKGELTVEQGKVLNEELKHNIKKTVKEKVNAVKPTSAEDLSDLLDKMTPEQIAALKEQILKKEAASSEDAGKKTKVVQRLTENRHQTTDERRMSTIEPIEYNSRLREITAVLRKHNITRGVTPKKLRADPGGSGTYIYQAGADHVHAFGHSCRKDTAMN